ncbi:hypothetical protein B0J18DRAFT_208116 [Chaetomium sp. MPI-SDFR-AT-0129]|nr:hypothetical protein B0J18DRAFT_208116 [Chaetomium sp. MPI-SDFR-AT-0129]
MMPTRQAQFAILDFPLSFLLPPTPTPLLAPFFLLSYLSLSQPSCFLFPLVIRCCFSPFTSHTTFTGRQRRGHTKRATDIILRDFAITTLCSLFMSSSASTLPFYYELLTQKVDRLIDGRMIWMLVWCGGVSGMLRGLGDAMLWMDNTKQDNTQCIAGVYNILFSKLCYRVLEGM